MKSYGTTLSSNLKVFLCTTENGTNPGSSVSKISSAETNS